jgi:hypothetical protein
MRRLNSLGLYSKGAEKASELPEGSFPAQQLIASLLNKGGISKDELLNAGVIDESNKPHPDWVKRGKIRKQDLIEHLHDALPQISEVVRHRDPTREINELSKSTKALEGNMGFYPKGSPEREEREQILQERRAKLAELQHIKETMVPDKFGDLTLPYQKNYRELLLQLQAPRQWQNGNPVTKEDLATEQGRIDADRAAAFVDTPFQSTHWDTPNVLAHIRMSDRRGPRDEKILHIEELQSDWGQKARRQGTVKANEKKLIQLDATKHSHPVGSPEREEADRNLQTFIDKNFPGAPEGPYITNTAAWTDLALKRVLHEAAKGGYDQIVWTPGQQHANRYKLRNYVDRVAYDPEEKELSYVRKNEDGWESHDDPVEPHELGKIIGEDAAQKLLSTPPSKLSGIHNLETPGLEFGGEGMKGYYDKIVPTRLQKLAQSHDPQAKVGLSNVKLPPDTERGDPDEPIKPLGLTITPQMRQSILQGQSAFRDGGAVDDEYEDGITAYHGSPHDFDQFDISKIGTGEGAQSYGHGLYFAEAEPVAMEYRDKLTGVDTSPFTKMGLAPHHVKAAESYVKTSDPTQPEVAAKDFANWVGVNHTPELTEAFKNAKKQGHMYEVHIKAHPDHFLDWDKPLREQKEVLEKILSKFGGEDVVRNAYSRWDELNSNLIQDGRTIDYDASHPLWQEYDRLSALSKDRAVIKLGGLLEKLDNEAKNPEKYPPDRMVTQKGEDLWRAVSQMDKSNAAASLAFHEIGVPGIKYFDAGSRGASGKRTRNYVVFDHDHVAVKRKYAQGGVVG